MDPSVPICPRPIREEGANTVLMVAIHIPSATKERSSRVAEQATASSPLSGKKLVVLTHGLEMGGAERQAFVFASELAARNQCGVAVWSLRPGEWGVKLGRQLGLEVRVLGFGIPSTTASVLHMTAGLVRRLNSTGVDYVVPFLDLPNLLGNLAWRLTGVRACLWNQRNASPTVFHRPLQKLALRLCGGVVGNSEAAIASLQTTFRSTPKSPSVVHNGVRLAKPRLSRKEWRRRLDIPDTSPAVCMLANLSAYKDHETVVKAWRLVINSVKTIPDATNPVLVLAGRHDKNAARVHQLVGETETADSVRLPGFVQDVRGLLAAMDLGILSSDSEGCPNSVLEYAVAGLPVVSSDLPGVREVIPNENHRWLVEPRSAEGFAAAIMALLLESNLRDEVGERNRKFALDRFTPEHMTDGMIAALMAAHRSHPNKAGRGR